MKKITLDDQYASRFIENSEVLAIQAEVEKAAALLESQTGPGNDFLGWLDLPVDFDKAEFQAIKTASDRIRNQSEVLIVIGIGGSYLGAKAALSFLLPTFYNEMPADQRPGPAIYFAGTNLSGTALEDLMALVEGRDFSINVISKSGTTTEPAIAFRLLKRRLEEQYGREGAKDRIYATTDKSKGALRTLADQEGYATFVVPDNVGGRFSVLTAVGLLPLAVAGVNLDELMEGAAAGRMESQKPFDDNDCYHYVALRNILYRKGKAIEMLISYEPRLTYMAEWWKQLYGESEGKEGKGIFPAAASFTADLHSLGQYIQEGERHLFETLLTIESPGSALKITSDEQNLDGLNYLAGRSVDEVNEKAAEGTLMAHVDGGVPNLIIRIPEASAFYLGYLFYFFEKACAVSGYVLGVNPFDQPGVEAYKRNMFRLLGKP